MIVRDGQFGEVSATMTIADRLRDMLYSSAFLQPANPLLPTATTNPILSLVSPSLTPMPIATTANHPDAINSEALIPGTERYARALGLPWPPVATTPNVPKPAPTTLIGTGLAPDYVKLGGSVAQPAAATPTATADKPSSSGASIALVAAGALAVFLLMRSRR